MERNGTPTIVPGLTKMMDVNLELLVYVDPAQCPNGIEVTFTIPGQIAPAGGGIVKPGCIVAVVPPGMAQQMLAMMRNTAQQRRVGPGEVNAPGL